MFALFNSNMMGATSETGLLYLAKHPRSPLVFCRLKFSE